MSQNLLSLSFSDEMSHAIHTSLIEMEPRLPGLLALEADTRRQADKMGGKSEAFVRQTLTVDIPAVPSRLELHRPSTLPAGQSSILKRRVNWTGKPLLPGRSMSVAVNSAVSL